MLSSGPGVSAPLLPRWQPQWCPPASPSQRLCPHSSCPLRQEFLRSGLQPFRAVTDCRAIKCPRITCLSARGHGSTPSLWGLFSPDTTIPFSCFTTRLPTAWRGPCQPRSVYLILQPLLALSYFVSPLAPMRCLSSMKYRTQSSVFSPTNIHFPSPDGTD